MTGWEIERIERWIVVNPESGEKMVQRFGSVVKPREFTSRAAAQFAADDLNNPA